MSRPRRSARQLAEMLRNPGGILNDPQYRWEPACRRWLDHVDHSAHFDLPAALRSAVLGVRLALRIDRDRKATKGTNRCIVVRAYAVLGSTHRAASQLDKARRYLAKATDLARRCASPDDVSDLYRRRAILTANLAQRKDGSLDAVGLQNASQLAEASVRCACGSLVAVRGRNARGMILLYSGDWYSATRDAKWALGKLDPKEWPLDHVSVLSLLVNALAKGEESDRQEAARYLDQLQAALPPRCPAIRARFLWAEGLLYFHNRQRKARARKRLDQARRKFLASGRESEAVAVTADLVRHAPSGAVPRLCTDLLAILEPGPIRDLVQRLERTRLVERVDLAEELRSTIHGALILPAVT